MKYYTTLKKTLFSVDPDMDLLLMCRHEKVPDSLTSFGTHQVCGLGIGEQNKYSPQKQASYRNLHA